jgi:hypothetical protein
MVVTPLLKNIVITNQIKSIGPKLTCQTSSIKIEIMKIRKNYPSTDYFINLLTYKYLYVFIYLQRIEIKE